MLTCNRCKVEKDEELFKSIRGKTTRNCQPCRDYINANRKKNNCKHERLRNNCKECGGASVCEHDRRRRECNICSGVKALISKMINSSRKKDRLANRYDANNFIDKCFLQGLFEENPDLICPYCQDKMNTDEVNPKLVTIERIDNKIGHIKSNCILACLKCNCERVGQRENLNED